MATTIVKGDLYEQLDGKLCEIKRQMRQKEGYAFDPHRLDLALQALIEGRFEAVGGKFPSELLAVDSIPKGWSVTKDVEPSKTLDVNKLTPCAVLNRAQPVSTDTMRQRAVELKANWGLVDGLRIIAGWTPELAKRFNGFYIPLPGTELRASDGRLYVPYLHCRDGQCVLDFDWVDCGWLGFARFAVSE